jgi:hypothetical protein
VAKTLAVAYARTAAEWMLIMPTYKKLKVSKVFLMIIIFEQRRKKLRLK